MLADATDRVGQIFIDRIKERIEQNQNALLCFVGQTGSGKSYASMSLALVLDPEFSADRIYFDIGRFIEDLSQNKFRKGNVVIIDDSGISISNRNWQSIFNKAIGIIAQSFRFLNLIVIFNVPRVRFIELQVRSLIHFYLIHKGGRGSFAIKETREIEDLNTSMDVVAESIKLDDDSILSEIYFFPPFDEDLIREYEKRKADFMINVYRELALKLNPDKKDKDVEVECDHCGEKNFISLTTKHFKCKSCGLWNTP